MAQAPPLSSLLFLPPVLLDVVGAWSRSRVVHERTTIKTTTAAQGPSASRQARLKLHANVRRQVLYRRQGINENPSADSDSPAYLAVMRRL